MLTDHSLMAGIKVIQHHGKALVVSIVSILEKFLKNAALRTENQIATLVFLGVTAPFVGVHHSQSSESISKKILVLFEKGNENL